MADRNTVYKNGVKEIGGAQRPRGADLHGQMDDGRVGFVVPSVLEPVVAPTGATPLDWDEAAAGYH